MMLAAGVVAFCVRKPHLIARHLAAKLVGEVVWSVRSSTRVVALTLDDGPHPATTPGLVDLLGRYGARATFFLIGVRASRHEDLVRQIVAGGHELGNHLLSDYPSFLLPATEFQAQLVQVDAILRHFGRVRYFRPGSGFFTPRMLQIASENNYRCALGTISTLDTDSRNPQAVADRIAKKVRPGDVIVLHEGSPDRVRVVTVVERLLADLTARGYRFVTLTELAGSSRSVIPK
jgi:peptidoglycan/xylan/chitin deacetylase (PgdA/CDA1 family)